MRINEVKDGVILEVNVKPNSKEFKIVVEGEEIVVSALNRLLREKLTKNY